MRRVAIGMITGLAIYAISDARAAGSTVVANLTAMRVVAQSDGKETLATADKAKPGDVLEYRVDYHNTSRADVGDVVATLPVPPVNAEYIPGTESPRGAQASMDGKTYSALPLMRAIKLPNGRTEMKPVPAAEIRFLRWSLGSLPADAHKSVSARVRLVTDKPVETAPSSKSDGTRP